MSNGREREDREYHKKVQESETEMVWTREESRTRIPWKKDSGEEIEDVQSRDGWTVSTET